MLKIPNIPELPEKEEMQYKEKEFFLSLYEQFQSSSKVWFYILLALLVLVIPIKLVLRQNLANFFISRYHPPAVNLNPYIPQDLKILKTQALSVVPGQISLYAQILNSNSDISAKEIDYQFVVRDQNGNVVKTVPGKGYLLAGESRFLLVPSVNLATSPKALELILDKVYWTKLVPHFDIKLEVLQKNFGISPEGKFFVEGLVRNSNGFQIKKVEIGIIIFDQANQNIVGINSTLMTDLLPLESRYFRVLWPQGKIFTPGQIVATPYLNPLEPGVILEKPEKVPAR